MTVTEHACAILAALVDEARDNGNLPFIAARIRSERTGPGQGVLSDEDMEALDEELDALTGIPA